jgi:hypothetical protein
MSKRPNQSSFKRRDQYPVQSAQEEQEEQVLAQQDEPEDLVEKSITQFFDQLFAVSLDNATLEQAREAFQPTVAEIKKLDVDAQQATIRALDFFVGRVKQSIEPVLIEWYRTFKK